MEKNEKELVIPENCLPVEYLIMGFTMYDILAIGICVVTQSQHISRLPICHTW